MRYVVANGVTAAIAALLAAAALLFAWARSGAGPSPAAPGPLGGAAAASGAPESAGPAALPPPEAAEPPALAPPGRDVYAEECGFCHGNGVEDRAALGRMADDVYRAEGGAVELVDFLLKGVEATPERDLDHPPFDHLSDAQIADLLEYLLAYGPAEETAGARPPITVSDVAARRQGD